MSKDEVENRIKDILKEAYPNLWNMHIDFIGKMVDYCEQINKKPDALFLQNPYDEFAQQKILGDVADRIKHELIDEKRNYVWRNDNPKDEYEKGLYCAMRYIHQVIHWMQPD